MHLSTAQLDRTIPPTKKKNENVSIDATFFCNENAREIDKIIYSLNKRMVDLKFQSMSTETRAKVNTGPEIPGRARYRVGSALARSVHQASESFFGCIAYS